MARTVLNNDEIKFLTDRMKAGRTWAQAKSDLVAYAPDVDPAAGIDAGFQAGVTARAAKELREHAPGPETELEHLRSYATPVPTALDVATGPAAGSTAVAIAGHCFVAGATVTFGGAVATVVAIRSTEVFVTSPAHAAAAVDVVVTNPNTLTGTLAGAFTYT